MVDATRDVPQRELEIASKVLTTFSARGRADLVAAAGGSA
jgi:hypothetical protein